VIIQTILVVALAGCLIYGFVKGGHSRLVRWPMVLTSALGIYFVLHPGRTTEIAIALGVGRGADLLLYLWVVVTLLLFVRIALVQVQHRQEMTSLARELALRTASHPGNEARSREGPVLDSRPSRP
jgi:hypothetical protein